MQIQAKVGAEGAEVGYAGRQSPIAEHARKALFHNNANLEIRTGFAQ
jgi:hypothetical protein